MRYSPSYRFTISSLDDNRLAELRNKVRVKNSNSNGVLYRVVLRARLGKNNPNAEYYRARAQMGCINPYQIIRMAHGSHFDVYVYVR
jgi:hypothetical protein